MEMEKEDEVERDNGKEGKERKGKFGTPKNGRKRIREG